MNGSKKAIVRRVIASLGEQKGRHWELFYRQGSGLTTGGFMSGVHGLPFKLISCTLSSFTLYF